MSEKNNPERAEQTRYSIATHIGVDGQDNGVSAPVERIAIRLCGGLLLAIVLLQASLVALRNFFSVTLPWAQELVIYFHAGLIALGVGLALLANRHVQIDVLRERMNLGCREAIDRIGLISTIAACCLLLWFVWPFVYASFSIAEGSREVGGLPGLYLLKSLLLVYLVMLGGAACVRLIRGSS